MNITESYLSINEHSRPGTYLKKVSGIILHWVGKPMQTARSVRLFFEVDCPFTKHYSSAHYIIDFTGEVLKIVPENEIAYHCGSSKVDPVSNKIYTDWARKKFGIYAEDPINKSPNQVTLGIELCTIDNDGNFRDTTIESAIELSANLLKRFNLTINNLGTHNMVVGWKDCPKLWTKKPNLFEAFKEDVNRRLLNG